MATSGENLPSSPHPKLSKKQYLQCILTFLGTITIPAVYVMTVGVYETLPLMFDLILVVAIPVFAWASFRQLRNGYTPPEPHRKHYRARILGAWALGLLVFAVYATRNTQLKSVGFDFRSINVFVGWCLLLAIGSAPIFTLFRWMGARGWLPPSPRFTLFPENRSQRLVCLFLVAPTMGFCEELVYRSYVLSEISHWFKGCPTLISLFLSCILFALTHMAGGPSAFLQSFLAGALLAWPVVYSGTLYPSIVIHTLYDAFVLAWLGPKLARQATGSSPSLI
jgi:membrane protease YdiL (CAAX protease family)